MPVKMCSSSDSATDSVADSSVAASKAKNISSNKRHSFCSIYLSVISDLIKTRSQHITKRKTLLIDMCDRCIHPKTVSAIAQRL